MSATNSMTDSSREARAPRVSMLSPVSASRSVPWSAIYRGPRSRSKLGRGGDSIFDELEAPETRSSVVMYILPPHAGVDSQVQAPRRLAFPRFEAGARSPTLGKASD